MVEAAVGLQDVMTVARATKVKEMHNRELISKKNRRWQIWRRGATGTQAMTDRAPAPTDSVAAAIDESQG